MVAVDWCNEYAKELKTNITVEDISALLKVVYSVGIIDSALHSAKENIYKKLSPDLNKRTH